MIVGALLLLPADERAAGWPVDDVDAQHCDVVCGAGVGRAADDEETWLALAREAGDFLAARPRPG